MKRSLPLAALTRWSVAHPKRVLLCAGLLLIAGAVTLPQIQIKASNLDLIDVTLPEPARFLKFAHDFGNPNPLIIVLWGDSPETLGHTVHDLADALSAIKGVDSVTATLPVEEEVLERAGMSPFFTDDLENRFYLFVQLEDRRSDVNTMGPVVGRIKDLLSERLKPPIQSGLTGIPKYALDDQDVIKNDIQTWSIASILLIGLLFTLGFKRIRRPLIAVAALPFGILPTLIMAVFYPGHLTLLSALFASILFGLGVDFGIHLVAAFEDETAEGKTCAQAAVAVVTRLENSLSTSALTTAGAFAVLTLSGFRGFEELGVLTAVGTLSCLTASVTLLPALLVLLPGKPHAHAAPAQAPMIPARATLLAALVLLICTLGGLMLGPPGFQDDYRALQPKHSQALELEEQMIHESEYSPYFAAFVVPDAAASEALAQTLRETPGVGAVRALTDLAYFYDEGETVPEPPESFANLFRDAAGHYAVYAYPAGDIWDPIVKADFNQRMRALDSHVTGMPFLSDFMMNHALDALKKTSLWALLFLVLIMAWDFGSPGPVLAAMVVPATAVSLTLTGMKLLGISLNPLNVMAFPVILGVSVDDGVHLLHRYLDPSPDREGAAARSMRGIILTSLTTMAAFGCIAFSAHRGLRYFCLTVVIGVAAALIASATFIPPLGRRLAKARFGSNA